MKYTLRETMEKKRLFILLCAVMTLSLVACGEEKSENQFIEEICDVRGENDNSPATENVGEVTGIEDNEGTNVTQDGFINVLIENGFVRILINHEDMTILNKESTECWIRFYDNDDRSSGIEITAMKENFVVVPIPLEGGEPLADGYNANAYVTGTVLSFDFTNEEVAKSIGSSEYYEIIIRDWNDSSTPRMIMDGNSESIEGIRTSIASDQEVSEEGNESDEVSINNQTDQYNLLIGSWEENKRHMVYTFYEDRTVKEWFTTDELRCSYFSEATFDGVNIKFKYSDGTYGCLGPITLNDKSFTINAGGWDGDNITFYLKNSPSNAD